MELKILQNGTLQIDDAAIIWRNFKGEGTKYNRRGDRNFTLVIPDPEIAEVLRNDVNQWGVGWNVKIKDPLEEGMTPLMHMKVKVAFNSRGPKIYLRTGRVRKIITEEMVHLLDDIDIESVDLDIRPFDGDGEGLNGPFRSAYLSSMEIHQRVDRFEERAFEEGYGID